MEKISVRGRVLFAFLATMLMLSLSPGLASAADANDVAEVGGTGYATLQAAIDAATDGETITLMQDVAEAVTVTATAKIDLNGCKITSNDSTLTIDGGTLTVVDSSDAKTGKVVTNAIGAEAFAVRGNGTLYFDGGTVTAVKYGIYLYDSGSTVVMNGGTVVAPSKYGVYVEKGSFQMKSGLITIPEQMPGSMAINVYGASGSVHISGGSIDANGASCPIRAQTEEDVIFISGGTFDFEPSSDYIADGSAKVNKGDGMWIVRAVPEALAEAEIDEDVLSSAAESGFLSKIIAFFKDLFCLR